MKYVILNLAEHSSLFFKKYIAYDFAENTDFAPLVEVEFGNTVLSYPMGFIKKGGQYQIGAILSPKPGENLFIDARGNWLVSYIPSFFRGYPFRLEEVDGGTEPVLAADFESGLISSDRIGGQPIFGATGGFSETVLKIESFLRQVESSRQQTQRAVDLLAEYEVIAPWEWQIIENQKPWPVTGISRISMSRLEQLTPEQFLALREVGAMALVWAQIYSMGQIQNFARLAQLQKESRSAQEISIDLNQTYI